MKTFKAIALAGLYTGCAHAQIIIQDSFDGSDLDPRWATTATSADGGARITGGMAELTNDKSTAANASGSVALTALLDPLVFEPTLTLNPGPVTWTFNLRQPRATPSGFSSGGYGAALLLAGSSSDLSVANGYAVVLGNSGSPDPLRLVRVTGGLDSNANLTDLLTTSAPLQDPGATYLSVRVEYEPATDAWSLFARNDGTTGFADPGAGTLAAFGTMTETTYTSEDLNQLGLYWNHATTAHQSALFDNLSVVVVPEPYAASWAVGLGLLGLTFWRRVHPRIP